MENIRLIRPVNVSRMQRKLACLPDELWNEHTQRQAQTKSQKQVKNIMICWSDPALSSPPFWIEKQLKIFREELDPILDEVDTRYSRNKILRVLLASLGPGKEILPHKDLDPIHLSSHRLHVPIVTNSSVSFIVRGVPHYLEEGNLYEINTQVEHSVKNDGRFYRIHLLIDILKNSQEQGTYNENSNYRT